jgi:hypothetical protein
MRLDILERRLTCLQYYFIGAKPSNWIPLIARRYNVSESAVSRDWSRRHDWLPKLAQLQPAETKVAELIKRLELTLETAFKKTVSSSNESVQIGAARTVGQLTRELFSIGQDVGLYPSLEREILEKLTRLEEEIQ